MQQKQLSEKSRFILKNARRFALLVVLGFLGLGAGRRWLQVHALSLRGGTPLGVQSAFGVLTFLALPSRSLSHDQYILHCLLRATPTPRGATEAEGFW